MIEKYEDDICDRCRVYPKNEMYILCVKCKNEWIAYGIKILNSKPNGFHLPKEAFEIWFESKKKKPPFMFR